MITPKKIEGVFEGTIVEISPGYRRITLEGTIADLHSSRPVPEPDHSKYPRCPYCGHFLDELVSTSRHLWTCPHCLMK